MIKIILTGTYCSCNKGDAAMEIGALQALSKTIRDADITIHTPFPEIDRKVYKTIKLFKCSRRNLIKSSFLLLRCIVWSFFNRRFKTDLKFLLSNPELQEYNKSDIIVDLSGDTLTEDYGIHVTISHFFPILIGIFLQKPVVLCAQTIGPFKIMRPLANFALNRAALITTREEITRDYLQQIGIQKPDIHITADVAFLLEPASQERVKEIMSIEDIDEKDVPLVGISVSRLIGHRYGIGNTGSKHDTFEALMAEVVNYMIEKMGVKIIFISHVTGPTEKKDDRVMAGRICQRVKQGAKIKAIAGNYTPEEVKGIIGKCELFIGVRMHSNIAATSMRVPTIAISYSRKTLGIMKMLGQERWICDIGTLTLGEVVSKIEEVWSIRQKIKDELVANLKVIRKRSLQNAELVKKLLLKIKEGDNL